MNYCLVDDPTVEVPRTVCPVESLSHTNEVTQRENKSGV